MKLYIHPMSSNARRAHMAAMMLGHEPEIVFVDLQKGGQKAPDFVALNPNGKVPVLVDGDVVLWESIAIMQYLADKTPGQSLYPTELAARARVNQWLSWTTAHWGLVISQLNWENFLKGMFGQGGPNEYVVDKFTVMFHDIAKVLDGQLGKSRYVAGDQLTLADLAIAAPLMYAQVGKLPIAPYTHVNRWFSEMRELSAWKETEPKH